MEKELRIAIEAALEAGKVVIEVYGRDLLN